MYKKIFIDFRIIPAKGFDGCADCAVGAAAAGVELDAEELWAAGAAGSGFGADSYFEIS